MAGEARVVVVSVGEPPGPLIQELRQRGLVVVESGFADAEEEIEKLEPDLVVLFGSRGAMELTTLLDDASRKLRPRLAIVAGGRELSRLWGLNRDIVVSLLASEMSVRVIAERLQALAKQWARPVGDSPSIAAPRVETPRLGAVAPRHVHVSETVAPAPTELPVPLATKANETKSGDLATLLSLAPHFDPPVQPEPSALRIDHPAEAPKAKLELKAPESMTPSFQPGPEVKAERATLPAQKPEGAREKEVLTPLTPPVAALALSTPSDSNPPDEFEDLEEIGLSSFPPAPNDSPETEASGAPTLGTSQDEIETRRAPEVAEIEAARNDAPVSAFEDEFFRPAPPPVETKTSAAPAVQGRSKLGLGLLLAVVLGGGAWAVSGMIGKRPTAPAKSSAPGAKANAAPAHDAPSSTNAPGAEATDPAAPAETAATAEPSAPAPTSTANPFLTTDAHLPGCEQLAAGITPATNNPAGEASTAWKIARQAIVKGDLTTANQKMCEAVTLHPESAALEGLALLYVTRNSPSEALKWVQRAETVRPGQMETRNLLGDVYSQLGDSEKALEAWLLALKVKPEETERRQMIAKNDTSVGRGYLRQGDVPHAERLLRRAVTLDPNNALGLSAMAEVCLKQSRSLCAIAFAERSLALFEANPDAHVVVGDAALLAGDRAKAKASYQRALGVRPDFWAATLKLRELD